MLLELGSFAGIWLLLWVLLGLFFAAIYPLVRRFLLRQHPAHGSGLMLAYWSGPVLLSLLGAGLLFFPGTEQMLVGGHCHPGSDACLPHAPATSSPLLAGFGLSCLLAVITVLFCRGVMMGIRSQKLYRQFGLLAEQRPGYFLIDAVEPIVFTLGWWRPRVYISRSLIEQCTARDLAVVLAHEHAHRMRRDNLRIMLARLLASVLPREAAAGLLQDLQYLTEEACDFQAAERHGFITVAEVLLKVKKILQGQEYGLPLVARAFAETQVEARIKALLRAEERTSPGRWRIMFGSLAVVISLMILVEPLHHGVEWLIGMPVSH